MGWRNCSYSKLQWDVQIILGLNITSNFNNNGFTDNFVDHDNLLCLIDSNSESCDNISAGEWR